MNTENIKLGKRYTYWITKKVEGVAERVAKGEYIPLGITRHVHAMQYTVVYRAVDDPDPLRWFNCPLVDWSLRFTLTEDPEPPAGK